MEVLPAVIAWATATACHFPLVVDSALGQRFCSRAAIDVLELVQHLSSAAQVLPAGAHGFDDASRRWSVFDEPRPGVVVIPGTASDVAATVSIPFACHPTRLA